MVCCAAVNVTYYSRYGIGPEDVGLSQQQIIFGALRFCLAGKFLSSLGDLAPAAILGVLVIYVAVWRVVRYFYFRSRRFMDAPIRTSNRVLLIIAIYLSTLLALLITASYFFVRQDQAQAWKDVKDFQSVRPVDMNFLMIQADPAVVIWVDKSTPRPERLPGPTTQVMYLGHSDKMATIHDPVDSLTWRVPEDAVLITIQPTSEKTDTAQKVE